jgi:hypothetical protein
MKKRYTAVELHSLLEQSVKEAGSQAKFADQHDISRQYLGDVLRRKRAPGERILEALGMEKVVEFRRVGP